jgi:hypothetical protein
MLNHVRFRNARYKSHINVLNMKFNNVLVNSEPHSGKDII